MSAIIELVARSAIRPGTEQYAKLRGTRGAATLLKSNVTVYGETVKLRFRAKGAKQIDKEVHAPKLAAAIDVLRQLPGRRLFQYRTEAGDLRTASAQDVNLFLREIAGVEISLKDFRTLLASVSVLEALARAEPATSERARNRQIVDAICEAAAELGNTPAICRKSYVHETVVDASRTARWSSSPRRCAPLAPPPGANRSWPRSPRRWRISGRLNGHGRLHRRPSCRRASIRRRSPAAPTGGCC